MTYEELLDELDRIARDWNRETCGLPTRPASNAAMVEMMAVEMMAAVARFRVEAARKQAVEGDKP